jgi:Xaa-Pro aminopeptidase
MTTGAFDVGRSVATAHRDRLRRAAAEASERGVDALLITPSPDYTYLLGYAAPAMERLTCLLVPADGDPALLLPRLEEPLARQQLGGLADAVEIVP